MLYTVYHYIKILRGTLGIKNLEILQHLDTLYIKNITLVYTAINLINIYQNGSRVSTGCSFKVSLFKKKILK